MAKLKNYKNIIRLAIPIILANASAPLLGLADTATIGQTAHAAELGAISLAALVFSFVYWGFGFLRMGTTGFIAQAKGKSDPDEVLAVLFRSVILGLGIGVLMILLQYFIGSAALWMLSASEEVKLLVADYFYIRIYGAPATLITYSILGSLIGLGLTKELMWVQFALNGLNILLNVFFVVGLDMGVKGIALGTLIAEWIALLFGWYLLSRKLQIKHVWKSIKELWQQIIDKVQMIAMFKVNGDIMIRTFALLGGFAWFANEGAKFGDATLAANHVLLQFVSLSAFFLDGFANVIEMYAGTAIGKDDKSLFKQRIWETTKVSGVTAFLLGLGIILLAPSAISLLTQDQNVQVIAENHAIYAGIYIVLSFVAFQLDGVFIGATRSKEMRNATVLSFIVLIGLGTFTTHQFGNIGLWIAFIAFVIVRGLGLGLYLPKLMRTSFSGEVD